METDLPGPRDLIEYLKQPGLKKTEGQLADPKTGGRCCLGHYADMCGIWYDPEEGSFVRFSSLEQRLRSYDTYCTRATQPALPDEHWLFMGEQDGSTLQNELQALNDNALDFASVIERLEEFADEH